MVILMSSLVPCAMPNKSTLSEINESLRRKSGFVENQDVIPA